MQLYEAICKICQHMKNHEKSFFLFCNFAGQQLIHISYSPDIELGVNMGKRRPNYVAPHVVKPCSKSKLCRPSLPCLFEATVELRAKPRGMLPRLDTT